MSAYQSSNGAYQNTNFAYQSGTPAPVPSVGGGASGAYKYRVPKWWEEGRRAKLQKKLEQQVEAVQKRIEAKRKQIDVAPDLYRMERLVEELQALQKRLMTLLERIDQLNKLYEEEEVMAVYTIYRSLH
jgi:hypothetical protein